MSDEPKRRPAKLVPKERVLPAAQWQAAKLVDRARRLERAAEDRLREDRDRRDGGAIQGVHYPLTKAEREGKSYWVNNTDDESNSNGENSSSRRWRPYTPENTRWVENWQKREGIVWPNANTPLEPLELARYNSISESNDNRARREAQYTQSAAG